MNLLSVDWDYFFPTRTIGQPDWEMFDWACNDNWSNGPLAGAIWRTRAAAFVYNGLSLPGTSGDEAGFWQRFRFAAGAELYVSDKHVMCAQVCTPDVRRVRIYDAHHDGGYSGSMLTILRNKRVSSEDWTAAPSLLGADVSVYYPRWKGMIEPPPIVPMKRYVDRGARAKHVWHVVHICRSGGWAPPWIDAQFAEFVRECERATAASAVHLEDVTPRRWSVAEVEEEARQMSVMRSLAHKEMTA